MAETTLLERNEIPEIEIHTHTINYLVMMDGIPMEIVRHKLQMDPFNPNDFAGFTISNHVYEPIMPDNQGRVISQQLGLALDYCK